MDVVIITGVVTDAMTDATAESTAVRRILSVPPSPPFLLCKNESCSREMMIPIVFVIVVGIGIVVAIIRRRSHPHSSPRLSPPISASSPSLPKRVRVVVRLTTATFV